MSSALLLNLLNAGDRKTAPPPLPSTTTSAHGLLTSLLSPTTPRSPPPPPLKLPNLASNEGADSLLALLSPRCVGNSASPPPAANDGSALLGLLNSVASPTSSQPQSNSAEGKLPDTLPNGQDKKSIVVTNQLPAIASPSPRGVAAWGTNSTGALTEAVEIDASLHALQRLGQLHSTGSFHDAASSGYHSSSPMAHIEEHSLDLLALQPLGVQTLHPAKLECNPLALLPSSFEPAVSDTQRVNLLGSEVALYVMKQGRARLLHTQTGARALLRDSHGMTSVFAFAASSSWVIVGLARTLEGDFVTAWRVPNTFGLDDDQSDEVVESLGELYNGGGRVLGVQPLGEFQQQLQFLRLLLLTSDGRTQALTIDVNNPSACSLTDVYNGDGKPIVFDTSADRSLLSVVLCNASGDLSVILRELDSPPDDDTVALKQIPIETPSHLTSAQQKKPSYAALLSPEGSQDVHGIMLAFDNNTTLALYDFVSAQPRIVIRLSADAASCAQQAAHWNIIRLFSAGKGSTTAIVIASALRSSLMVLPLTLSALPASSQTETATRLFSRLDESAAVSNFSVSIRFSEACEYALPEPCLSAHLAQLEHSCKLLALHPGGVHLIELPSSFLKGTEQIAEDAAGTLQLEGVGAQDDPSVDEVSAHPSSEAVIAQGSPPPPSASVAVLSAVPHLSAAAQIESEDDSSVPRSESQRRTRSRGGQRVRDRRQRNLADDDVTDADEAASVIASPAPAAAVEELKKAAMLSPSPGPASPSPGGSRSKRRGRGGLSTASIGNASPMSAPLPLPNTQGRDGGLARALREIDTSLSGSASDLRPMFDDMEDRLFQRLRKDQQQSRASAMSATDVQNIAAAILPHLSGVMVESVQRQLSVNISAALVHALPAELHRLMLRPELVAHLTHSIAGAVLPPIQHTAMDVLSRVMAPHFEQVIQGLSERVERSFTAEARSVRKDILAEQNEGLSQAEAILRDVLRKNGEMSDQLEALTRNDARLERAVAELKDQLDEALVARTRAEAQLGPVPQSVRLVPGLPPAHASPPSSQQASFAHDAWYDPFPQSAPLSAATDKVEDLLLAALSSPGVETDMTPVTRALQQLEETYSTPERALWSNIGPSTLRISQPVVLTLLHRLAFALRDEARGAPQPHQTLAWLDTVARALNPEGNDIQAFWSACRIDIRQALDQAAACRQDLKYSRQWVANIQGLLSDRQP